MTTMLTNAACRVALCQRARYQRLRMPAWELTNIATADGEIDLGSPAQPVGTPFRYWPIEFGDAVTIDNNQLILRGMFVRAQRTCTTDADCACDPAVDDACPVATMVCGDGGWCRQP